MRKIQKWSVVIGVCSLTMVLSGCSTIADVVKNQEQSTVEVEKTFVATEDASEEAETEIKEEPKATSYERGILTVDSFESEYMGIRFMLPEDAILSTQEEADSLMEEGADELYADEGQAIIDYAMASVVCEMIAMTADQGANITVSVEKIFFKNMTIEQYLEAVKSQLAEIEGEYEVEDTYTTVTIAGEEYTQLSSNTSYEGMTIKQKYAVRKLEDRMLIFVMTYTDDSEEGLESLLAGFTPY